jgi:hypothetical protein
MQALLPIHIAAGTLSVLAGAAALLLRKGGKAHRAAGSVFVVSMTTMAVTAALVGMDDPGNAVAGTLTIYMVVTAWMTARRKDKGAGVFEIAAFVAALACAIGGYWSAYLIASGAKQADNPYIVFATLFISSVMALAALGDFSVVLRRGLSGAQRIARHLWRMCFGLLIAVGSFAAQGAEALPPALPRGELLLASMAVVLLAMAYWSVRVLFTGWFRRTQNPAAVSD